MSFLSTIHLTRVLPIPINLIYTKSVTPTRGPGQSIIGEVHYSLMEYIPKKGIGSIGVERIADITI